MNANHCRKDFRDDSWERAWQRLLMAEVWTKTGPAIKAAVRRLPDGSDPEISCQDAIDMAAAAGIPDLAPPRCSTFWTGTCPGPITAPSGRFTSL